MSQQNQHAQFQQEEEIDLREEFEKYSRYWPWFVAGVLVSVLIAFLYLRYSTPIYLTTATIIIKDEEKGGAMGELAAYADMGLFSGMGTSSIENEMGILRSKRLMTDVVKKLQLNTQYFLEGNIRTSEIYSESPIELQFLQLDEEILEIEPQNFQISETSNGFRMKNSETGAEVTAAFGEPVDLDFATIVINKISRENSETEEEQPPGFPLLVTFSPVEKVASAYRQKVQMNLTDKNASLIEITLNDPVKEKARNILDQLIYEYNRQAIEDKNLVARNTASFVEDRLKIITGELDSVETGKENFKEANQLTDIEAESEMFIENVSDFNTKRQEVGTQLELSNAMLDYLKTDKASDLLPANLGIAEEGVNSVITQYNNLVLERNRILSGSTERNPVIIDLNRQIEQIRGNVLRSLQQMRSNLLIAKEELDRQAAIMGSKIASVPGKEKQFRGIERQQNIKEALYLFLLQKREETSLSLAVTAPKAKIVDSAYTQEEPVSPESIIILSAALILGVLIPFMIIYLKNLFNNKVRSQKDMEKAAKQIPVVGEIPRVGKREKDLIEVNDRSILAESFRILHTNLQYLLVNAGDKGSGKIFFITSTVKGEGKTFIAFNLAITLANIGKKVLIVGADLRNPQLQRYESGARKLVGVSDYLLNNSLTLKELIKTSSLNKNLDLLASGTIPPNPSELWRRDRTAILFEQLENLYDYVIVDTAPAMLVTDTFLINKHADLTLYVVRSGYTEQKLLQFAVDSKNDGKLHDVSFILNDVELANFGYGNKYGYPYGQDGESFWKRMRKMT
ncbi:MAG TPA: polysaccharide biosynthesis tyrosine autokinase, partial [Gillisia sp.]|nr:polysaccharide biosynthesis tyrosine autokinase [Gillisia sp.]